MKPIFSLGLLGLLALGCSSMTPAASTQQVNKAEAAAPTPIAQTTSSPNSGARRQTPQRQKVYPSAKFGFRFGYPHDYVVDNSKENRRPQPGETWQGTIEIWKSTDYQALRAGSYQGGTEAPPNININVHSNSSQRPLSYWKDTLTIGSSSVRTLTVGGQQAIAFTSDGLYGFDNVMLLSPDRRRVIWLNRGYLNPSDPSRQAFQQIVSSFSFR